MAHFYGTVQGGRGEASRLGSQKSGMVTTCNSYTLGIKCVASAPYGTDRDLFIVDFNTGSSSRNYNAGSVDYRITPEGKHVVEPDIAFFTHISPDAWRAAFDHPTKGPELRAHMRQLLFTNGIAIHEPG